MSGWFGRCADRCCGRCTPSSRSVSALLALAASIFHLGRPLFAFRAVLGLRTSWLSREIVAFGVFAGLAWPYAASVERRLSAYAAFALADVAERGLASCSRWRRCRRRRWRRLLFGHDLRRDTARRSGAARDVASDFALHIVLCSAWRRCGCSARRWRRSARRHRNGIGRLLRTVSRCSWRRHGLAPSWRWSGHVPASLAIAGMTPLKRIGPAACSATCASRAVARLAPRCASAASCCR